MYIHILKTVNRNVVVRRHVDTHIGHIPSLALSNCCGKVVVVVVPVIKEAGVVAQITFYLNVILQKLHFEALV